MYFTIGLQNVPNQFISTTVNGQNITIGLFTKTIKYKNDAKNYLFASIYKENVKIVNYCLVINGQFILQYNRQLDKLKGNLFILDSTNIDLDYNNFNKTAILYYTDEDYPELQKQKYFEKTYIANNEFLTDAQIRLMP